ncbi:MAG: 16S rRNA (guanine(527)-N(7))-methyltransferase RsmG [Armatimonadota bacterium]
MTFEQSMESAARVLADGAAAFDIELTRPQQAQFSAYLRELLAWNRRMNLTAITDPVSVATHHFLDSLSCLTVVRPDPGARVIDVGTGGGFPGVPVKIVRPDIELTLLDSLRKRIVFLEHLVSVLGLSEVTLCHARAEDAGRSPVHREAYDVVLSRAVAQLSVLVEYCLPLARVGGTFVAMKGPKGHEELAEAENALKVLGGEVVEVEELQLPVAGERRLLVVIRKARRTPGRYPRKAGEPSRHPL